MRNLFDNPVLLIVLLLIIVLVFGAKRLPDAARSVGRSMRIFKSEVKEMKDDDDRPAPGSRPIEGRVVDDPDPGVSDPHRTAEPHRASDPGRTDEPHRGA